MKKLQIKNIFEKYKQSTVFHVALHIILGLALFFSAFDNVRPEVVDIRLLAISEHTMTSPITVIDQVATELRREEAANRVPNVYDFDADVAEQRVQVINSFFEQVITVKQESEPTVENESENPTVIPMEEQLNRVKEEIPIEDALTDEQIVTLLEATPAELQTAQSTLATVVNSVMGEEIAVAAVNQARNRASSDLAFTNVSQPVREVVQVLGRYAIVANHFFNAEATAVQRDAAESAVDPVTILQGQVLVREGDQITREIYDQLQLVGLGEGVVNYHAYFGLAGMVLLLLLFVYIQSRVLGFHQKEKIFQFGAYVLIVVGTTGIMKGISLFQTTFTNIGYVVPVAVATILIYFMLHPRLVFPTALIFSVLGSLIFNEGVAGNFNFSIGIYYLFSSTSVLFFLQSRKRNRMILRAGMFISLINLGTVATLFLLKNIPYSLFTFGTLFLLTVASGMLSSILAVGTLPYLEDGFGMISHMKLMELSSPNHPLLREILLKAPGTYHHSIMVANLSEAACEAIGTDGMLARIGAYYHDIGKTIQPQNFIENQIGIGNPHDQFTPKQSRDIIFAHVTNGIKILKEHRMPQEIIDICQQHHGTSFLRYFYVKASEKDETVTKEEFRYSGPTPLTKISAIVGIADSVEAAVRSLNPPTTENISKLVKDIINEKLQDGQFDACDITMKELQLIQKTLCEILIGIFHSRIQYPELKK